MANRYMDPATGEIGEYDDVLDRWNVIGKAGEGDFAHVSVPIPQPPAAPQAPDIERVARGVVAEEAGRAAKAIGTGQFGEYIQPAVLPAAGAVTGMLTGGPIGAAIGAGPKVAAMIPIILEALGAAGGEAANQAMGVTPPSPAMIGMNAALPVVGRGLGVAGRKLLLSAPGAATGRSELAVKMLKETPDILTKAMTGDPEVLYGVAHATNANAAVRDLLPRTAATAQRLLGVEEGTRFPYPELQRAAGELAERAAEQPTPVAPTIKDMQRVGQSIRGAGTPEERGGLKELYKALAEDLEAAAPNNPGIAAAMEARRNYRIQQTAEDLDALADAVIKTDTAGKTLRARSNTFINRLERPGTPKDKDLVKDLKDLGVYEQVLESAREAGRVGGRLEPGQRSDFFRRHLGLAFLGAAGGAAAGAPEAATGALAGYGLAALSEAGLGTRPGAWMVQRAARRRALAPAPLLTPGTVAAGNQIFNERQLRPTEPNLLDVMLGRLGRFIPGGQ